MKAIEGIDLRKCFELAHKNVKEKLEQQVAQQIEQQLMAVAQLKIKASTTVTEGDKLLKQLEQKEQLIAKIESGEWSAVAETARERNEKAEGEEKK